MDRSPDWAVVAESAARSAVPATLTAGAGFWQHESYDRIVRDAAELAAFRRYIARNPATAKLRPDEFSYDVASWLDEFAERPTIDVVVS